MERSPPIPGPTTSSTNPTGGIEHNGNRGGREFSANFHGYNPLRMRGVGRFKWLLKNKGEERILGPLDHCATVFVVGVFVKLIFNYI